MKSKRNYSIFGHKYAKHHEQKTTIDAIATTNLNCLSLYNYCIRTSTHNVFCYKHARSCKIYILKARDNQEGFTIYILF